jgi:hypothetical protein
MNMEHLVEWELAGDTEVLGENLPQHHFVHHKSHNDLTGNWTWTAAVGSQWLTTWAVAQPGCQVSTVCTPVCHLNSTGHVLLPGHWTVHEKSRSSVAVVALALWDGSVCGSCYNTHPANLDSTKSTAHWDRSKKNSQQLSSKCAYIS